MGGFYREKGGARELLTKERVVFRPGCLLGGKGMVRVLSCRPPLFSIGGMVRAHPDKLSH